MDPAQNTDAWNGTLFFDPEDAIYTDHFPGKPVVPGSLIVHGFLKAAEKWGVDTAGCRLENFRFKRFVTPGEYGVSLRRLPGSKGENRLACELVAHETTLVTGILRT